MPDGRTSQARLARLLHVLPAASRDGGASLSELARTLDAPEERILEDIQEVTARNYYHPGGWLDDVAIYFEADRVRVARADGFERPSRLTPDEILCLALALRGAAASARVPSPEVRERLLDRVEGYLAHRSWQGDLAPALARTDHAADPEGIRDVLMEAARDRRPCALMYVKAGADGATLRVIHPYVMAYAEGAWYAVGHCMVEDAIRIFRADRVMAADLADGTFDVPEDFDATAYVDGGRVFTGRQTEREVRIRYSARVARWIRERAAWGAGTIEDDGGGHGGVVVRHRVADPHWAVGHALQHGADAEILEPGEVRALLVDVARRLIAD